MVFLPTRRKPTSRRACGLSRSLLETNERPTPASGYNDWYQLCCQFWYQSPCSVKGAPAGRAAFGGLPLTRRAAIRWLWREQGIPLLPLSSSGANPKEAGRADAPVSRLSSGIHRARPWTAARGRSVKRCSASSGAARLAIAAARPGAAREAQGGRACSVREHDAPRREAGRLRSPCSLARQKQSRAIAPRGACAVCRDAPHLALLCAGAAQCPRGTRGGRSPPFPPSLSGILRFSFFPSERRLFFCPGGGAWWVSRLGGGTTRRLRREDGLSMPSANVPSACPSGRKTPSERQRRVRP